MRSRAPRQLFVLTVLARPHHDNQECADVGGAYVSCWLDVDSEQGATSRVAGEIRDAGWVLESIESIGVATREDYDESDPNRQYFEQALIDTVVLVFNTWPNEPQDGDPTH